MQYITVTLIDLVIQLIHASLDSVVSHNNKKCVKNLERGFVDNLAELKL